MDLTFLFNNFNKLLQFITLFSCANKPDLILERYEALLKQGQLSPNTIRAYLSAPSTFYNMFKRINAENVLLYQEYLRKKHTPNSFNLRVISFNRFLSFIGKQKYSLKMVKCRQSNYLDKTFADEDYIRFKAFLNNRKDKKWFFIVWTLAATGVRISELVQFQFRDIRNGYVEILSKGNKVRRVFIPQQLQEALLAWLELQGITTGNIFRSTRGTPISIRGISKGLEREAVKAGIDPHLVHPHAFRHLFAKKFLENNSDITMLANLLGHESLDTTKIYLRRTSQEQKIIIDRIVNW